MPEEPVDARPRSRWWVAVVTFVVGVVVGVVVVGLLNAGTPDFVAEAEGAGVDPSSAPSDAASPSAGPTEGVSGTAEVNAACLRVINDAQDSYRALTGIGEAVGDLDFQTLDDIVRRLQPLVPRLRQNLTDCRVDTGVGGREAPFEPAPTATASPTG